MIEFLVDGVLHTVVVRNSLNAGCIPVVGEKNSGISLTVPDQALSVRQILERYARGLPLGGQRTPVFDEDDDLPDVRTLDLSERQEMRERYVEELGELTKKIRENEKKSLETVPVGTGQALGTADEV